MNENHINYLFTAYLNQSATNDEMVKFFTYIESLEYEEAIQNLLEKHYKEAGTEKSVDPSTAKAILETIFTASYDAAVVAGRNDKVSGSASIEKQVTGFGKHPVSFVRFFKKSWFRYAAILLLLFAIGAYLWYPEKENSKLVVAETVKPVKDIQPGGNHAILTLADGSTIVLDSSVADGKLARQGNASILKLHSGSLAYRAEDRVATTGEILYNTIRTPRGGQYQVVLQDGSKVWLNAASSLRFPTVFGKERIVAITGEAYFEVAKNVNAPFRVNVNEETAIEVLGTDFNVNAYTDEANISATLLNGSVRVKSYKGLQELTPGLQAQVDKAGDIKLVKVDIAQVMAWKNGAFAFNEADIYTVMRQLSRWYDVDVEYEGALPKGRFNGEIGRDLTLSQVLKVLTQTRVNYEIEDGRIIILP